MFQNALPAIGLLVLMMLAAWMLQRWKRHLPGRLGQTGVPMEVTGGLSLGPQHRLVSVRIGQGAEQVHVVLGVAPQGIQTVATLTAAPTDGAFAARLAEASRTQEGA